MNFEMILIMDLTTYDKSEVLIPQDFFQQVHFIFGNFEVNILHLTRLLNLKY